MAVLCGTTVGTTSRRSQQFGCSGLLLPQFTSGIGRRDRGSKRMTKDPKTLLLCGIACVLAAIVCHYVSEGRAEKQTSPPKEYVVCVLDEDKNPSDCVP